MQVGFNQPHTNSLISSLIIYITYFDDLGTYGEYDPDTGFIYLNKARWSSPEETVSHEYFHSIQNSYLHSSPVAFHETSATYASLQYCLDNNYSFSDLMEQKYSYFFIKNEPTKFYEDKYYDGLYYPDTLKGYSNFIFICYLAYEYCNGDALSLLEDYYSSLSSSQSNYYDCIDILISLINSNLSFEDVFNDFIEVVYPAKLIDSDLGVLDDFGNDTYEKDVLIQKYNEESYNQSIVMPKRSYYVFSIIAPSNTYGKLNISFSNIGSDINLSALYKTADSVYHNVSFVTGGNGSKNYSLDNFCSYEIIDNNNEVMVINIHISNGSNTSQNIYFSYYFDFKVHDNAIYYIINCESEYLISSSFYSGNLYQSSNSNLLQKWIFKKQNNGSYIICLFNDDDYHFVVDSINSNSNCYLSNSYTYYYRFIITNYTYYNTMCLYDNQMYYLASYDLSQGSPTGNLINSSGNVITYYNHAGNLSMWKLGI